MKKNTLKHIAVIMDGNGRWAQKKMQPRTFGHKKGASIIQDITQVAIDNSVSFITFYAFSTENWKRENKEVEYLMKLLDYYLKNEGEFYQKNNVRFNVIGDLSKLSSSLQEQLQESMDKTKNNTAITQSIAINYGSHDEIVNSAKYLQENNIKITKQALCENLYTKDMPYVDMLVRTGGHKRISNYLLWQIAYAELFFTNSLWPDFKRDELQKMIEEFYLIKRNFGDIK